MIIVTGATGKLGQGYRGETFEEPAFRSGRRQCS